ncbi:Yip1 domain-containing protein [Marininema mesophilum]|uniref:Yip1 domain-containing protein n=1 Tax=Marininema mesophilum TaxID=1048340 RepID=A0A1H2X3L7_9BACL|nr:YIP1 family protein [Marininema mesophilum]SDW87378.1 Yip1 domain-containing protein [Marininema mesophilum]
MDQIKPWLSIWLRTRETIQSLINDTPLSRQLLLVALFGLVFGYDSAVSRTLGDKYSFGLIVVGSPILGIIQGLVMWIVISWLIYWIGSRFFSGDADWMETRIAMAWGGIPFIVKGILWIPQLLLFQKDNFTTLHPLLDTSVLLSVLFWIFGLMDLVLTVWYVVVISKSVGEAHNISSIQGFGILLLSFLVVIVAMILISLIGFALFML